MYYTMPFCTAYYMWYYLEICCVIICLYMSPAWNKIKAMDFFCPLSVGSAAPAPGWVRRPRYRVSKYLLREWMSPNSDTHLGRTTNLAGDRCCRGSRMTLSSSSDCDHFDHEGPWLSHSLYASAGGIFVVHNWTLVFPHSSDSEESAYNAGNLGSIPGLGRSPGGGNGHPLQYSYLKNRMDRGAPDCSPWGRKEAETMERLTLHFNGILCRQQSGCKCSWFSRFRVTEAR